MSKRFWALALSCALLAHPVSSALAATLGPASSCAELRALLESAGENDTVLVSGVIQAGDEEPLTAASSVRIASQDGAVLSGLRLRDISVSFSNVTLEDTLTIDGTSHVHLASGVTVTGAQEQPGISFSGNGALIVDRGCHIEGGGGDSGGPGISISHSGGDFYGSIEGDVAGGAGENGGPGKIVSPLRTSAAIMISGSIQGGEGQSLGGHALNLYELSGNAYVTVEGQLRGGDGAIGGDGIQIVSASDDVAVGVGGQVKGGQGASHGGNALILMSAEDASSVNLSGHLAGGDALGEDALPGTSLHLVGNSASLRTRIVNCILEDGVQITPTPAPTATPDPAATATPAPSEEPAEEQAPPASEATPGEAASEGEADTEGEQPDQTAQPEQTVAPDTQPEQPEQTVAPDAQPEQPEQTAGPDTQPEQPEQTAAPDTQPEQTETPGGETMEATPGEASA